MLMMTGCKLLTTTLYYFVRRITHNRHFVQSASTVAVSVNVNLLACFRISVGLGVTRWWRDGLTNSKSCQRTQVPTHTGTDTVYTHTRTCIHVSKGYTVYCCVTKLHRMSHQLWSEHMEQLSHPHSSHMCIHGAHTDTQHTWCNLHKFPFPHFLHYKKPP